MRMQASLTLTALSLLLSIIAFGQDNSPARPKITSLSHLSVYTSNPAQTERFYVQDMGALKGLDPQNPAGVRYYFNSVQFVEVLPLPHASPSVNRLDHAGYNTSNAEGMRKFLESHGVAVPPKVTKASDGSQYFEVKDPEGNRIQFVEPPEHPIPVSDRIS